MTHGNTVPSAAVQEEWPEPLDPRTAPVPRYGQGSLADLLPAITAGQGLAGMETSFVLEPADRACVFLVDGMGWEALAAHPAVSQVAVIGIPHDVYGEAVHAVVVVKPEHAVTEDELIGHARGLIAGYKVPKSVTFREEPLPLSGAMKVLKRELRAPFWEGHQRGVN